ncbi:MAG: dihydrofolate reductase family protein, partial [Nocardioides sp.]
MGRIIYLTATSLDGFIADRANSLDWLFAVPGGDEAMSEVTGFTEGVGVMVEGSTTYAWMLDHEDLIEHPEKWQEFYADRPTFVFTSRNLPSVSG